MSKDIKKFRDMTEGEIRDLLKKSQAELVDLRFQLAVRKLKNHREIPALRRKIAQLKTILNESDQQESEAIPA